MKKLSVIALFALLTACSHSPELDLSRASAIIPGQSRSADITAIYGAAYSQVPLQDNGQLITYKYNTHMTPNIGTMRSNRDYLAFVLKGDIVQEKYIMRDQNKTVCIISVCDSSKTTIKIPLEQYNAQ